MSRRAPKNPHLKTLEQALAARYGWQPGVLRDAVVATVSRKADRLGLDEVSYCRMAAASGGELQAFAEEVAPADSRFFREPSHFEALRSRVVPELVAARAPARKLRMWSVASAGGEEPYSLAMVVRETVPQIEEWRVEIFASDLRGHAIMSGTRARYAASHVRAIDPTVRNRYFMGVDEPGPDRELDLIALVRRMVTFRRANLCEPHVWRQIPGPYDLILCENLLVYFHARAVEVLVDRLAAAVAPDGYLVVDPAEVGLIPRVAFRPAETLPAGFFRLATGDRS